jgi:hypothetical protein
MMYTQTPSAPTSIPESSTPIAGGKPAASWAAIAAGAFVSVGASFILLALGAGLGFASVSPWSNQGVSATTFTVATAIWLIVTQWVSAALGGYIAGRLRVRWVGTHSHEVFFRDTAHGLVTWAVATAAIVAVLGASTSAGISGAVRTAASAAADGTSKAASATTPADEYALDRLFRSQGSAANANNAAASRAQAADIAVNAVATGSLSEPDRTYLASLVASDTGASPSDAQQRVEDFISAAKDRAERLRAAADEARRAAAEASIYLALSLLVGAFIASVSAALGGRLRDEHP